MSNNYDVSQLGEQWGREVHRDMKITRCQNGYMVKYKCQSDRKSHPDREDMYPRTKEVTRVFITNSDLFEFVEKYFEGEPKP